jgi:hypothetical protein
MAVTTPEAHPAADAFPMLDDDEINALAVDIVRNGLLEPVVLAPDGRVIDGRNRLAACRLVHVEPQYVTYEGDPWTYSRSANLWRRNMTTGQRAAACAISLIAEGKRRNGRWARGSVPGDGGDTSKNRSSDPWAESMAKAGVVADWSNDDDLLVAVRDGRVALDAAYKQAKAREERAQWEADQAAKAAAAEIAVSDAELAKLLSLGHETLALDLDLIDKAADADNWRGVVSLADRICKQWTQLKEKAHARLPE